MCSRFCSTFRLALTVCALVGVPALEAAAPRNAVEDIERILQDRDLLYVIASTRLDVVLDAWDDPAWGGILDREIYRGLPIDESTKDWLAGPEAQNADEVIRLAAGQLYQLEEAIGTASARAVLREVARDVVAADLADRLLAQIQGDDARLREIVRLNLGLSGAPIAALALRRVEDSPRYFRAILSDVEILKDPWLCATAAGRLSQEWRRSAWLPTLGIEQLLSVARPTSPFAQSLRQEAIDELQARSPHTDWPEVVSQRESAHLVDYLTGWLSEPALMRLPPIEILRDITLRSAVDRQNEMMIVPQFFLHRAVDNDVLGRAVLSRDPENLAAVVEVADIVDKVAADPDFFLALLETWDVIDHGMLVAAALERVRGRPEVDDWLATLREGELEYVAANEERLFSRWIMEAARERLGAVQSRLQR